MNRSFLSRILCLTLLIACGFPAAAQHVPGVRWMQREGERFILIYPESLSSQAGELAGALDRMLALTAESLPPPREARKWPIILRDRKSVV